MSEHVTLDNSGAIKFLAPRLSNLARHVTCGFAEKRKCGRVHDFIYYGSMKRRRELNDNCEMFAAFEIASTNIVPVEIEPTAAVVPLKMVFKLNFLNMLKNTGQGDPPSSAPAV